MLSYLNKHVLTYFYNTPHRQAYVSFRAYKISISHLITVTVSKNILSWSRYHSFHSGYQNVDESLRYMEILLFYKLKKHKGDVLEKDIELCPFRYFPATIAVKEEANFPCKFFRFHNFSVCCFSFCADT